LKLFCLAQGFKSFKQQLNSLDNNSIDKIILPVDSSLIYVLTRIEVYVGHNQHDIFKVKGTSGEYLPR